MLKKIRFMSCIILTFLLLSGCVSSNYTREQEDIISDYVAQIVFKHSKGYDYRLESVTDNPFIREEIDEGTSEDKDVLDKDIISEGKESEDDEKDNSSKDETPMEEKTSLASALDFDENIKVEVMKTTFSDELTKGAYYLEVDKDEKLCVIYLKITNNSKKRVKVKSKNSVFKLETEKKTYNKLMTALEDDISFLSRNIEAGKSITTKVVFKIDIENQKSVKTLYVETGSKQTTVDLD